MNMRPVVLVGSQRTKGRIEKVAAYLKECGGPTAIVMLPDFRGRTSSVMQKTEPERVKSRTYREKLAGRILHHLNRIAMVGNLGGVCYLYNPTVSINNVEYPGYVGMNSCGEVFFATAHEMCVIAYQKPNEPALEELVFEYMTPRQLVDFLGGDPRLAAREPQ